MPDWPAAVRLIQLNCTDRRGANVHGHSRKFAMRIAPLAAGLAAFFLCSGAAAQKPAPADPASVVRAPRVTPESTPGWDMLTDTERADYRKRMIAAPTPAECRRIRDEQYKMSAERARNRGIKDLPNARYDACGD